MLYWKTPRCNATSQCASSGLHLTCTHAFSYVPRLENICQSSSSQETQIKRTVNASQLMLDYPGLCCFQQCKQLHAMSSLIKAICCKRLHTDQYICIRFERQFPAGQKCFVLTESKHVIHVELDQHFVKGAIPIKTGLNWKLNDNNRSNIITFSKNWLIIFVNKLFIYILLLCTCECVPHSSFCCEISKHSSTFRSFCFEKLIGEQLNLPINCSSGCTCEICLYIVCVSFKSFPCFMHVCAHLQCGCTLAWLRSLAGTW